ncbi:MAG: histidine--tRNA ligase [Elusimicrobia bacterium CG08_land_8_20_14_0_20_51_18]|nr:MAG: histidine--tRNA ligase [Elusimicrobia bacterium CG08_land_8_20_14_0_20_51_18]
MLTTIRGFRDILPPQSDVFSRIEKAAREIFRLYNYREIRVPTAEYYELFVKSTGETTDIVEKEMYRFKDQSDRDLALRPEGTPGVARAYINNNLSQSGKNSKFYYIGSMFRAERPQAGRFREFEQLGAESIGNKSFHSDAESIILLNDIISAVGIKSYRAEINSIGCAECRKKYREKLLSYLKSKTELCEQCQKRIERNPLRALDCKLDAPKLTDIPEIALCPDCLEHHNGLKKSLDLSKINYSENKFLVRGLDYYSRTVFEFKTDLLGSQDAIAAGGRYDNLIRSMGGPDAPSVGWAMGVDRAAMLIEKDFDLSGLDPSVFVISTAGEYSDYCFALTGELRKDGIASDFSDFSLSLKSQMRSADKSGAAFAVIVGEEEYKAGGCSVKDLKNKTQETVRREELAAFIRSRSK